MKIIDDDASVLEKKEDPAGAKPLHILCLVGKIDILTEILQREMVSIFVRHLLVILKYQLLSPTQCHKYLKTQYGGELYTGENCLHIAIANKNLGLCEMLINVCPDLMTQSATGSFFSWVIALITFPTFHNPRFQKQIKHKSDDDGDDGEGRGSCYYGGYPLRFLFTAKLLLSLSYILCSQLCNMFGPS